MSLVSAVLSIVPWYAWLLTAVVLILITALGLWPVVIALLRGARSAWVRLPVDVKIAACVIVGLSAMVVLHLWIVRARVDEAIDAERARGEARTASRLEAQRNYFQGQIQEARDSAQKKLDALGSLLVQEQADRERERKARDAKHAAQIAALKKGFEAYVTPLQLSRCSDVPRGYLVRRANQTAYANGGAESAGPPATAASLDEPSGVSLAALDAVDVEAAGAYRACRNRIIEWEQWGTGIDRYLESLQQILKPKGSTP